MIDVYDSEALVKIYRHLNKKCNYIDNYINNYAFNYGANCCEFDSEDICNSIINLMARKNQLINLKIIVDSAVKLLNKKEKKIIMLKMNYNLTMDDLCKVLDLKERTAFRHFKQALANLADALNESKYYNKLIEIMKNEMWIGELKEDIRLRRLSYKQAAV